jgi:molybdopterin-guanine dinucleotide biosynthesis adapter protein
MKVYGIIGWKNAGKTSLMERLVAEITERGFSVSTVKHVHHAVDLDQPGKDSYRHRAAGAREVVLASAQRFALMVEHRGPEPDLASVIARLAPVDLVLVEGYKRDTHAKIEVYRAETGHDLIQPGDPTVRAVASDANLAAVSVPVLDLNDTAAIADFVLREVGLGPIGDSAKIAASFDTIAIVDWSANTQRSPAKPSRDAIWIGICRPTGETAEYFRTRADAESALLALIERERAAHRRLLIGFDFAMGYPSGFARRLVGQEDPRRVWEWLAREVTDDPHNRNNRLDVAARINARLGTVGPFWVVNAHLSGPDLPFGKVGKVDFAAMNLAEHRVVERAATVGVPKSVWQLTGPGSVGSQSLTGLPVIHRLSQLPGVSVWPFDEVTSAPVVLAEVYPSMLMPALRAIADPIPDRAQVTLLARALWRLAQAGRLGDVMSVPAIAQTEGWILGAGHESLLLEGLA